MVNRYLWAPTVDLLLSDEKLTDPETPGDLYWALGDNLNTVRDIAKYHPDTDTTTVVNHRVFNGFGTMTSQTGAVDLIFRYTGRYYDPDTGLQSNWRRWYDAAIAQWTSEDPIGLGPDANPYRYVGNAPTAVTDPTGLWGRDVHYDRTMEWAQSLGYTEVAAKAIAEADDAVDHGATAPYPSPFGDQAYHFNRNLGGGEDSRVQLYNKHFGAAVAAVAKVNDDPKTAAKRLGISLHPHQDFVAHGDYGSKGDMPVDNTAARWHNKWSPQSEFGPPEEYPDRPDLDAVGDNGKVPSGSNGRPIKALLKVIDIGGGNNKEYAEYAEGTERIKLTEQRTKQALKRFKDAVVEPRGGRKCKEYFFGAGGPTHTST